MKWVAVYLLGVNVLAFLMYGLDKMKAKKDKWRIPEKTLIMVAVIGGSVGAFLGMQTFRHKTKHLKFTIGVPVIFVLQIVAVWYIWFR